MPPGAAPKSIGALDNQYGIWGPDRVLSELACDAARDAATFSSAAGGWQLDCQAALPLADDHRASICTFRDPVGAAILVAQAFDVT